MLTTISQNFITFFAKHLHSKKIRRSIALTMTQIKNTQRFLLNDQELNALLSTHWTAYIETTVLNDPTWGLNGSDDLHVVYLKDELTLTQFVQLGIDIQYRIQSNK
jgi:hypothetical protein